MPMSTIMWPRMAAGGNLPAAQPPPAPAPAPAPPMEEDEECHCEHCVHDEADLLGRDGDPQPSDVERLLDSTAVAQIVGDKMKKGDVVTISSEGKVVLSIKKDGVSAYDKFKLMATDVFNVSSAEVSNVVSQDPSFAFKESALAVQDQVFKGIPDNFKDLAQKSFLPMIRVVALALDTKKAVQTLQNKNASLADKFVDCGHVLTDIGGLGGAIALAFPGINPTIGTVLTAVGLLGDVAGYGYHVMQYFKDRGAPPPQFPSPDQPPPTWKGIPANKVGLQPKPRPATQRPAQVKPAPYAPAKKAV